MTVYVVIGARGGTGAQIVHSLARLPTTQVSEIRALVRDPLLARATGVLPTDERVTILAGDCTDAASLEIALEGAEGCFFAASGSGYEACQAVDLDGVGFCAEACKKAGVRRMVLVSSQLVDPVNRWNIIRGILNTIKTGFFHTDGLMDFKFAGENLLRASGMEYTIVRPGRLIDGPLCHAKVCVGQDNGSFMRGAATTRADAAATCVAAMFAQKARNTTFEIACEEPPQPGEPPVAAVTEDVFASLQEHWAGPEAVQSERANPAALAPVWTDR